MNFTQLDLYELKMILKLVLVYNMADKQYIKKLIQKIEIMEEEGDRNNHID